MKKALDIADTVLRVAFFINVPFSLIITYLNKAWDKPYYLLFVFVSFFLALYFAFFHNRVRSIIKLLFFLNANSGEVFSKMNSLSLLAGEIEKKMQRKRIVIMLPLSEDSDIHFKSEVKNCIRGIGRAIGKTKSKLEKIDIVLRDHKNDADTAVSIIKEELSNGSRHFICTMSSVCSELASEDETSPLHFNKILSDFNSGIKSNNASKTEQAILVCTVATSSKVVAKSGNLYRIFVQADVEANNIAKVISDWNKDKVHDIKSVCTIYSDAKKHDYSKESGEAFEKAMIKHGIKNNTIKIINEKDVVKELEENKKIIANADALFVFTYYDMNETILDYILTKKLFKENGLLISPTIFPKIHFEDSPYYQDKNGIRAKILSSDIKWYVSRPNKKNKAFYGELSEFCMNISFQKVINIVSKSGYEVGDFSYYWKHDDITKITEKFDFRYTAQWNDPPIITQLDKPDIYNSGVKE